MMFMMMGETLTQLTTAITSFVLVYAAIRQYLPHELMPYISQYTNKMVSFVWPYIHINFNEYSGDSFRRSKLYEDIQTYLSANSTTRAQKLKAHDVNDSKSMVISLDDNSEVNDEFQGVKLWWTSRKRSPVNSSWWGYPNSDEKRNFSLSFHRRHRELVTTSYLNHVVKQGKEIAIKNRKRKLYTNSSKENYYRGGKMTKWIGVEFEHPASFDTLALEPMLKQEIINDLLKFKTGKDYYAKVGKPWKRGYLLYGPPGTGKSTMISAMANFLDYDIYDLELTSVKDNTELRKLFIDSSNKSIIVIEDIDCSLDLTRQRKKKKEEDEESTDSASKKPKKEDYESDSKVTLSGLLNFIDGIWSGCGGERLIVFTTNYFDKLDPALIRSGRMDKHIELPYCCFEAFKVLANNYLDVVSHDLFPTIERLLGETDMTPADVTENLMPKSDNEDADNCLKKLVETLEKARDDAIRKKVEEEAKLKAADEENLDKESEENSAKIEGAKCNGTLAKEVKENGLVTT
ncbi:AAA-ATPase ASD, mitochondrial-like isoform X1 [Humulus lupulus]|uniref:AAA-ATPase ASD, mitochondrial-like isoform X1 n=1 Tax=Humulus lupulus TaxID=3486 RepID=UPI002B405178|nr:AAA-ATPase ASD, mitochondrial-like isoform X1 [Humulus lupulus]